MARFLTWTAPVALALTGGALWAQQAEPEPVFMTGAEPISPEDYAKLPKQGRFRAYLPKRVDLSSRYPPPGSQGPQPNCVAWATTYAARTFLNARDLDYQPAKPAEQMSPAYVYNRLRPPGTACVGTIGIVQALDLLKNEGTVSMADFPDDLTKCAIPASPALRDKAADYRLLDWRAIDRETRDDWRTPVILDDIKGALARGAPVIFAMPATPDFKAFRGDGVFKRDVKQMTNYHAMAIVGYDEERQALRIMNSWGPIWGDKGYAWVDYATFKLLAGEAYSLEAPSAKASPDAPPPPPAPAKTPQQLLTEKAAGLSCAGITITPGPRGQTVTGFGGDANELQSLHKLAMDADPRTRWQVMHQPWPQCEAAMTLASPLSRGGVTVMAQTDKGEARRGDPVVMKAGERFGVVATTTAARPHLSIIYLQADGSAVELYRGQPAPNARGQRMIGVGTGGPQQVRFEVAPPYGHEIIIALASATPLFGDDMKTYVTERQFLTGLRARLAGNKERDVSAAVLRLRTSE
ncbi:C1 family peptidase [Sphingobium sp. AN641]|uniref:C1 family peptidase n=1 Tax=Sphingobium sp. AN641 TaxID=3133443 RepID=UPI0030C548D8